MSRFVLTAQLQLAAPTNTRNVIDQIRRELRGSGGVEIPVEVRGARQAERAVENVRRETERATGAADALGRSFGLATRRFAAFTVASRAVSLLTNNLSKAVDEAIAFERELIKIAQVTGKSLKDLQGLTKTITELSTSLGVASSTLLGTARVLSQAGFKANDLQFALTALAKTELAPTFDDINKTAEGAIAIFSQFGQGARALEAQLGSINAVAGQFAVESGDLIDAVRRTGGVFKSAGGTLEEFLGLFTSIRATTRESAESIATGLRTILTRIQRPSTIAYLEELGVRLTDLDGKFVGPFEAAQRLGEAFGSLEQGDLKFIQIAEELGGFRQIGKVIPLLQQSALATDAYNAALQGTNSLSEDAETAQQSLAVQVAKVKEEFLALIRGLTDTGSFRLFTSVALGLASAFIKVADAIKPLLPLITAFAAVRFATGIGNFIGGAGAALRGVQPRNAGGEILGFARGGFVPGSGNRDTVPAMLTPGEFVIKQSSAAKLGAGTLQAMNENRFAGGGRIPLSDVLGENKSPAIGFAILETDKASVASSTYDVNPSVLQDKLAKAGYTVDGNRQEAFKRLITPKARTGARQGVSEENSKQLQAAIDAGLIAGTNVAAQNAASVFGVQGITGVSEDASSEFISSINSASRGNLFENIISVFQNNLQGTAFSETPGKPFDFEDGVDGLFGNTFNRLKGQTYVDAKASYDVASPRKNTGKIANQIADELIADEVLRQKYGITTLEQASLSGKGKPQKKNKGGGISGSSDTVPALLTPGEFVINKSAAQSIGYGNLNSMNKTGVARFASGGSVGVQKFANGGAAGIGFAAAGIGFALQAIDKFAAITDDASESTVKTNLALKGLLQTAIALGVIFKGFTFARGLINDWENGVKNSTTAIKQETQATREATQATEEAAQTSRQSTSGGDSDNSDDSGDESTKKLTKFQKEQIANEKKLADLTKKSNLNVRRSIRSAVKAIAADKKLTDTSRKLVSARRDEVIQTSKIETLSKKSRELRRAGVTADKNSQDIQKRTLATIEARTRALKKERTETRASITTLVTSESRLKKVRSISTLQTNKQSQAATALNARIQRRTKIEAINASTLKKSEVILGKMKAAYTNEARARKQALSTMTPFVRKLYGVATALTPARKGLAALTKEIQKINRESRKGKGFGQRVRSGFAQVGRGGAAGLGIVAGLAAIGSQIASGFQQFLDRQKDVALRQNDTAGAVRAAGASANAETLGELFTIAGYVEAVRDPEGFANRRAEKKQRAEADAAIQSATQISQLDLKGLNEGRFQNEDGSINFQEAAQDSAKAFQIASREISQLPYAERRAAESKLIDSQVEQITALANAGASLSDLQTIANSFTGGFGEGSKRLNKLIDSLILAREVQQQLNKANIDSLKITSAFNAANVAVSNFTKQITSGADPLQSFFSTFEASKQNIGIDASAAITEIENALVESASGAGANKLASSIQGQAATARAVNEFNATVGSRISTVNLRSGAAGKEDLEAALLEGIDDPQIRKAVRAKVNALNEDELATTDISKFVQEIQAEVGELSKGFSGAASALLAHNQQMAQLYAKREQLEQEAAQAQIKAIDTQIEAAKIAEEFGGPKVTSGAIEAARIAQFNAVGGLAGATLGTGSAQEIGRVRQQLSDQFAAANETAFQNIVLAGAGLSNRGAFAGQQGNVDDVRPETIRAQEALNTIIRQQIEAKKEELKLIKEKNEAEKSALDKLISGDVAGFIAQQEAAGAAAALETGNRGLAGLFDASALGAGFKELEKRGAATFEAAQATLASFGITDTSSARVLSGTTAQEEAAKSQIRALAGELGQLATDQAVIAQSNISIQDATITAAQVSFERGLRTTSENNTAQSTAVSQFARGGTVYANNGMFVPRGTDTVPAMLTPGEFVVNRSAVQRGNNLQILNAMNSGGGASSPTAKSGGGPVQYYMFGGIVDAINSAFTSAGNGLQGIFNQFAKSVETLSSTKFSIKLDPVQINITGGSFLGLLKQEIKDELLKEVGKELQKGGFNNTGSFTSSNSVLKKPTG
jgi:hypothetical protein